MELNGSQKVEERRAKIVEIWWRKTATAFPTRRKSAIFPPIVRLNSRKTVEGRFKSGTGNHRYRHSLIAVI